MEGLVTRTLPKDLVAVASSRTPAGVLPTDSAPRAKDRVCDHCDGTGRAGPLVICRPCGGSGWERTWDDFVRAAQIRAIRRNS